MLNAKQFREIVSGQRKGIAAATLRSLLAVAEIPYRTVVRYRNRQYDANPHRTTSVDVPVISVGNLTLGGTGKTPMVCWLAEWFRQQGVRVSIVSRGYGAKDGKPNDEALELDSRLPDVPHLQNPDRIAAANIAIDELETQLIILDDGFQHRRIGRDLEIVLVDVTEPFGFRHVFPRGTLRGPLTGLARADVVGLTRASQLNCEQRAEITDELKSLAPNAEHAELDHKPSILLSRSGMKQPLDMLKQKKVAAFCGIGNPNAFRHTLTSCGCELISFREFPDHHAFGREDIESIEQDINSAEIDLVVCTHKDLVKINLDRIGNCPLYAIVIEMQIINGLDSLESKLRLVLNQIDLES